MKLYATLAFFGMAHLTQQDVLLTIGAVAGAGYLLHKLRTYVFHPVWEILKGIVDWSRAHPVLMQIAKEFEPNAGSTLHDRMTGVEDALSHERRERERMQATVDETNNLVKSYIVERRPGGKRSTDPQPGEA